MEFRTVPAKHAWLWIKTGWALFRKSPLLWVALVMVGVAGTVAFAAIPAIGELLATLLFPLLLAGLMLGCRDLERGEELELPYLLAGFRHHPQSLITLGGVNLVGQMLILGIMSATGGAGLVEILMSGTQVDDPEVFAQATEGAGLAVTLGFSLFALLLMAGQFAPMLVVFENMRPIDALKTSLLGCLRNWTALLAFSLLMMPVAFIASMPMMLGWLVVMPLMITSSYVAYRDIFFATDATGAPASEERPTTPGSDM